MRRTLEEIDQNQYSEEIEKEERRRLEQLAEQNRKVIQEARESGKEESGPTAQTRPPIKPVERRPFAPATVPEFSQAVRDTVMGKSLGYNPKQVVPQLSFFKAAETAARDEAARKKETQRSLTQDRPSMEKELEELQKKEMEWYREEHEKGNAFGVEGYDRYVSVMDPEGTTEHGKAKQRIDELTRLLTLEANPQGTELEDDSATMYQDMAEIAKLPDDQKAALRAYAMVDHGLMMKGGYGEDEWEAWKRLPEEERSRSTDELMKMGPEKVKKLAEAYRRYYNQEKAAGVKESAARSMSGGAASKIGANLASIPAGIVGGVTGTGSILEESMRRLFGGSSYKTMDPNLPGYAPSQWAGTVRGETQRGIQESVPGFGGKALGSLYSAGMSAADNIARVALTGGTGSLALAGMGSFQSGVQEASEQGASPVRAVAMGVASGALEVLTEKVSLDQLLNTRSPETFRELLKNAAIQGGVEVSEEELSFAGNLLAEAVILQENSKSNQAFHQYLENGMTVEEAKRAVLNDNVLEAASTAVTSFLSGGMMSAGNGAQQVLASRKSSGPIDAQGATTTSAPVAKNVTQEKPSANLVNEAMQKTFQRKSPMEGQSETGTGRTPEVEDAIGRYRSEGAVSNSQAERILNNPDAVQYLQQNADLQIGGTNSQNRAAVKESIAQLVGQGPGTDVATQAQEAPEKRTVSNLETVDSAQPSLGEAAEQRSADDSTGAAPKGFDVYNSLQYDTGNKPDRANDSRPVNVPNLDTKGQRVSDFVANAYGAKVTPDSFIPVIEKMVTDGLVGADTKTNRETLEQAAAEISKVGDAVMMDRISRSAESGSINESEIAAAQLLFSKYANSDADGSQDTAAKLLVDMTDMARAAGRALQLHKMLRQLTPNGQMLAVEQQVSRYIDKINAKRGGKKQAKAEIPQELKDQFLKAKTADERSAAQESIYEVVASQIPSTFGEKFDALRYLSMLGNPKTHIRNVAGNAVFGRFVDVKRAVGAALEKSLPQEQRTKAVIGFGKDSRALLKWAKSDARTADIAELLSPSGTTGDKGKTKIDEYRKIFKIGALNKLSGWNANALEAEDMLFKRSSYASSLAGFLKARGYSVQDVQSGKIESSVLNEGRAYAAQEAMRATFNDINAFSKWASGLGRKDTGSEILNAVKKVISEGVLPFRKTPANIVVRGVDYSPAGIVRACYQYFTKVKTGEMTAAECMDTLAAGLTGTGVYALGALLSSLGVITGGSISDDEDRTGRQSYALNIGDTSITLDWMAPAAIPFFMGVETQKFMDDGYGDGVSAVTAVLHGLGSAAEPMLELSCLSSLNDLITSARYAEDGQAIISLVTNAATSYFTQVLPTVFGQFDQAADRNRKMVYTTASDPVMKELQRIAGRAFQKLPGDFFQTEYIDEWGRTEDKGNLFQRVFNAFLNPAYTSKINETSADKELSRLEESTGESQSPKAASRTINVQTEDGSETVRLSAAQWDALARKQGSTSYDLVSAMLDQEAYHILSDSGKRKAIESAYEYARELGKMEALPDRYTTPNTAWMVNLDGDTGEKAVAAILKRATVADVGATSEEIYDRAVEAGFSNSKMKAVFSGVNTRIKDIKGPTSYDKYRAVIDVCGKNPEKWLSVYGMTDNQLAEMKKLSTTPRQYVDALDANSRLSKAMKSVTDAWKNGETPDPSKLDEAYDFFKSLSGAKAAADPQFSSAISAYIDFRGALESSERFIASYKKYREISDKEGLTASERAMEWNYYLDRSGLKSQAKSALLDNLGFYQTMEQDAGKYAELTDAGLHAKQAKAVADLMKGLTPAPGKETVSNAQKFEAIHSVGMSDDQEEKALRVYLSESMEKNFDKALDLGISAGDWVELYLEYTNQKGTGKGQKNRLTQWCMQELGVDYSTARALADIYL